MILGRAGLIGTPPVYDVVELSRREGKVCGCVRMRGGRGLHLTLDPRESHRESWGDALAALRALIARGCVRWVHAGFGERELGHGLKGYRLDRVAEGLRELGEVLEAQGAGGEGAGRVRGARALRG